MRFYCPNCQKEYEVEPTETVTTLSNRVAYKAVCPTCGQDMAEFIPPTTTTTVPSTDIPSITTVVEDIPETTEAQQELNAAADVLNQNPLPEVPEGTNNNGPGISSK